MACHSAYAYMYMYDIYMSHCDLQKVSGVPTLHRLLSNPSTSRSSHMQRQKWLMQALCTF